MNENGHPVIRMEAVGKTYRSGSIEFEALRGIEPLEIGVRVDGPDLDARVGLPRGVHDGEAYRRGGRPYAGGRRADDAGRPVNAARSGRRTRRCNRRTSAGRRH